MPCIPSWTSMNSGMQRTSGLWLMAVPVQATRGRGSREGTGARLGRRGREPGQQVAGLDVDGGRYAVDRPAPGAAPQLAEDAVQDLGHIGLILPLGEGGAQPKANDKYHRHG